MNRCAYCGATKNLENDHIGPRSRGGRTVSENIIRACKSCNTSKNDRLPSEWRSDLDPMIYELEKIALQFHPKTPRRRRDAKTQKEKSVNVRCTEQQKAALESVAAREGLGVSTWLLHVGLLAAQDRRAKGAQR